MKTKASKIKAILLGLFFLPQWADAQAKIEMNLDAAKSAKKLDSIALVYGNKKSVDSIYRLAFYTAISYYEELKSIRIKFKEKKIKTTMAARPTFFSSFRSKKKRKYVIFVNTKANGGVPLYSEFTFNAKVGIIGHELAHILHYTKTGFFGLIGEGMRYGNEEYKSRYEKATDSSTIAKGLGWQVYDFNSQLHANPNLSESYKKYKLSIYYSPRELLGIMGNLGYEF